MGIVKRFVVVFFILCSAVYAEQIVLHDFKAGMFTSFLDTSEIADGNWNGEVSESSYGLFLNGKMKFSNIAHLSFETSYANHNFNWKNSSSWAATGNQDPFTDLSSWVVNCEYIKDLNKDFSFFTVFNNSLMYEDSMGGLSSLLAGGMYRNYYLSPSLVIKAGGGLFVLSTPSEESYMPFEKKNDSFGFGLYPYLKIVWNENTTGKYRQGASGYLEYGKGMVFKANLTATHNPVFSMDYFFISNRGEFQLDDDNNLESEGFIIKEDMTFGIRSNFKLQERMELTFEVNYVIERKWEILDQGSNSSRTLKPDACFAALIQLAYIF